ncbi:MAG: DnaJ domain-containing protein [Rhodospirillales bacterium]|nr:DnaJ domain-containing protein [Rhodospirillales bacterium]
MPYLVLGAAILIGVILAARWYVSAPPSSILRALKWGAIAALICLGIVLILTRNFMWAAFALPALLPWFMRARQAARMAKNWSRMSGAAAGGSGTAPGETSEIQTRFFKMYLDHGSGEMNGDVIFGQFAGKTLRGLGLPDLIALLGECREDEQSVQVLAAYLDRYYADDWRDMVGAGGFEGDGSSGASSGSMTAEEAYQVLGLEPGASTEEVKDAHKKLMSKIHPDHGGSTYLATKINQAKDFLLGQ